MRKLVMVLKILIIMSIAFNLFCSMTHSYRAEKPRGVKAISIQFKKNCKSSDIILYRKTFTAHIFKLYPGLSSVKRPMVAKRIVTVVYVYPPVQFLTQEYDALNTIYIIIIIITSPGLNACRSPMSHLFLTR